MGYRLAAELTLCVHALFILFVAFGGLFSLRRQWWAWLHLPMMAWAVTVTWTGWICPLTPLENHFRQLAAVDGYHGGFIEHYLVSFIYPDQLSILQQRLSGTALLAFNLLVYLCIFRRGIKTRGKVDE